MRTILHSVLLLCYTATSYGAPPTQQPLKNGLHGQTADLDTILWKLKTAQVIPDVLPSTFIPTYSLAIVFPSEHEEVDLGNTLPVASTSSRPVFQLTPLFTSQSPPPTRTLASNKTLTLVLSDPDATSRANPTKGQMCHWIVSGIARAAKAGSQSEAESESELEPQTLELHEWVGIDINGMALEGKDASELVKYMAPAPPPKTGSHRYVFVLLENEDEDGGKIKAPKKRPHFGFKKKGKGVMDWAGKNGLVPVGANFFFARNEKQ